MYHFATTPARVCWKIQRQMESSTYEFNGTRGDMSSHGPKDLL